ncbi:hypothetical protein [Acinetobacter pollinis]|uniref:hypothetical protein n=1 Tax=Acinetobacter pollinis TaxID=2605270 RepID=UPI0018C2AEFE|nr:hypothetical protein [Acinetobacter pollinis]MBF7694229.1 hypothetical protein [Acinetobacter pollinis]MBF7701790.1 hypothetical protein [Acinetobacter pollinis]
MSYLKKFLAITLIFVMQFQSVHASVAIGGGWGLNLTRVENSTSIFTAFKDGFQSTVAISPSSAQVAKSLLRGGLVGLALSAVTQALLDGIDFVMDSAKQEVRYVKIETQACNADLSNCTYAPYLYYLDYSSYRDKLYPTLESACIGFTKDQNINNPPYVYYYISTTAKPYMLCNINVTIQKMYGVPSSYYANKTANSKYSSSAKDPRKNVSIPLTTLATQIINLAEQGNPDAKAYIASVVQDMLEHDEDYRKSLEAQLDAKLQQAQSIGSNNGNNNNGGNSNSGNNSAPKPVPSTSGNSTTANPTPPTPPNNDDEDANQKINNVLKDAKFLKKSSTKQFEKVGGFTKAKEDFDSLGLQNVRGFSIKNRPAWHGQFKNGINVIVRDYSSEGSPTLEIQLNTKIEIRYK